MKVTTLFNLFCPLGVFFGVQGSVLWMILLTLGVSSSLLYVGSSVLSELELLESLNTLFPSLYLNTLLFWGVFMILFFLNSLSLVCFSYPVSTTLSFNLGLSLSFWLAAVLLLFLKSKGVSSLLPLGAPWYLASFLSVVEAISLFVRPITLCFRLLANMSAGHIMLGLMCKLPLGSWSFGVLFGVLELMVAVVQAFVFSMLISVYYLESLTH